MNLTSDTLQTRLAHNVVRERFALHHFFRRVQDTDLSAEGVGVFLGQWWHPLHYFPTFLARCVATFPDMASKSAITEILYQETGGGDPERAHEEIYVDTMRTAGFDPAVVTASAPFDETMALVQGYQAAAADVHSAVGFIFATEVGDLLMVSSIGHAVERVTGVSDLPWVRIHIEQEPDHVADAARALLSGFGSDEIDEIVRHAELMWRLWIGFFDRLETELAGARARTTQASPS
jgi:pyrroloquinoline quinone (PQQ) biosynthesis protein C